MLTLSTQLIILNYPISLFTDWLTYWLTDCLADWLNDYLPKWMSSWLTDRQTERLTACLADFLMDCLTDWVTVWLTVWLIDWQLIGITRYCIPCAMFLSTNPNKHRYWFLLQSRHTDFLPLLLTVVVWVSVMALGVLSVLCWKRFRNLSFMEQFLDYRQVPTATEANENTQEIRNGHATEVKETLDEEENHEKGWALDIILICYYLVVRLTTAIDAMLDIFFCDNQVVNRLQNVLREQCVGFLRSWSVQDCLAN